MTTIAQIILAIALVLSIILPFGYYLIGEKNRGRYKTALGVNAFFFFGTMLIAIAVMFICNVAILYLLLTQNTIVTQHSPSLINIRFIPIICIRFLHT